MKLRFITKLKLITSAVLVIINGTIHSMFSPIINNNLAMMQFKSSNEAYVTMTFMQRMMQYSWILVGLLILMMFLPSGIKVIKSKLKNN